ncbi:hypothetical protein [Rhodomicrobium lacus]|uniref:hypothetical protein n=1 Tax=Rhodomicrobium lacus TaxID=2498452 RepID=UPI0026E164B3|nr:hypothetical protein [Rhodomicrobium lacus]WKW49675.1 hypothetical protein QMO75_10220 [Rhodomicrobium lacus]
MKPLPDTTNNKIERAFDLIESGYLSRLRASVHRKAILRQADVRLRRYRLNEVAMCARALPKTPAEQTNLFSRKPGAERLENQGRFVAKSVVQPEIQEYYNLYTILVAGNTVAVFQQIFATPNVKSLK